MSITNQITKKDKTMGLHIPKELVLDCSKWICGHSSDPSENKLGEGETALLNDDGYMCCLGQFSKQAGLIDDELRNNFVVENLNKEVNDLCHEGYGTQLAEDAMSINDMHGMTIKERIIELKKLFSAKGYKIKVKNYKKATGKNWNE